MLAGCFGQKETTQLVPESPFGKAQPAPGIQRAAHSPASVETAARVDRLGRQILAANPQIGIKPLFVTIGAPQIELFHRNTSELTVTEGLVRQCATEGQLAAILCVELGKMVAEREALAAPQARRPDRQPPPDLRIGGEDNMFGPPDLTHQAELAKYDPPRRRDTTPPALPDPQQLARLYLTKAGFTAVELDQAAPILGMAQSSSVFEKQLTQPGPARPWTR
jgi:hypothetical protein